MRRDVRFRQIRVAHVVRRLHGQAPTGWKEGEIMLKAMTRTRAIQLWFSAVAVAAICSAVLGASVTASTAAMLLALCFVPPAIMLLLWPGIQPQTVAEVLHDVDRRP